MARLTDEQFMNMTINENIQYAYDHPNESWRSTKLFAKAMAETSTILIKQPFKKFDWTIK